MANLDDLEEVDEQVRVDALREVVAHAERFTREVARAKPIVSWRSRPFVLAAIAIPALALCIFTFSTQAEWAYGPDPARVAPQVRDAHTRMAMFLVAQRIASYRADAVAAGGAGGLLPASLAEIGEEWPGLSYRILDDSTFALTARVPAGGTLTLRSDQSATEFLGRSRDFLRERRP